MCCTQAQRIMLRFIYFIITTLLYSSCNIQTKNINQKLELIKTIPDYFDGCICLYSDTQEKLDNQQYLLIDGWDGIKTQFIVMKIDDKLEKLTLINEQIKDDTRSSKKKYSNDRYSVIFEIKFIESNGPDSYINKVKLIIESKQGNSHNINLKGECAC